MTFSPKKINFVQTNIKFYRSKISFHISKMRFPAKQKWVLLQSNNFHDAAPTKYRSYHFSQNASVLRKNISLFFAIPQNQQHFPYFPKTVFSDQKCPSTNWNYHSRNQNRLAKNQNKLPPKQNLFLPRKNNLLPSGNNLRRVETSFRQIETKINSQKTKITCREIAQNFAKPLEIPQN